jgi:hypothetical protein
MVAWSRDGGLTWSKATPALYGESYVRLKNGDHLLLPYYLNPRKEGMGAPNQLIPQGQQEIRVVKEGVTVTGWPRPDQSGPSQRLPTPGEDRPPGGHLLVHRNRRPG